MNENVTNKTPKRRRWVARLLVSALCILLASSLLFLSVVADNVNSFTLEQWAINTIGGYPRYTIGYWIDSSDSDMGYVRVGVLPDRSTLLVEAFSSYDTLIKSFTYVTSYSNLYDVSGCSSYGDYIAICVTVGDGSSSSLSYILGFNWNAVLLETYSFGGRASSTYVFFNGEEFGFVGSVTPSGESSGSGRYFLGDIDLGGSGNSALLYDTTFHSWFFVTNSYYFNVFTHAISYQSQTSLNSFVVRMAYSGKSVYHQARTSIIGAQTSSFLSFDDGVRSSVSASGVTFSFPGATSSYVLILSAGAFVSSSFSSSVVGVSITRSSGTSGSNPYLIYATSSEYIPPESSDETTEEPPPESSDESSEDPAGSLVDVYKSSPGSDPVFVQSVDLGEATSATVFLGSYLITDDTWGDISQYCYIQLYSDTGPLERVTFDFYATGFSYDNLTWDYPKIIGTNFDIDISDLETLYLSTLSPYGSVTVQNESVVLRQFNFQSSSAYVEIENVSAEEAVWYVYGSDTDSSPATFTTSGMQKYIIRRQSGNATIPVLLDYGSSGVVSASMTYNGSPFPVGGIIITDDPYLIPPIDTGSWDSVLSQAQSEQEFNQSIEDLLNSYIDDAYNTVSFDGDISDSFVGGAGVLGDILDTSGGSVIVNFFANMWTIHPYSLAMVGLVSTFLIFSFILRKS